ncbi:START domain-containing protein [Niabella sp. CJ426]|uniref:START domain-containing protein n=1 Tax=Niabella sp. CJ426 TaxID=3393740 RepID=UPI003D079B9B
MKTVLPYFAPLILALMFINVCSASDFELIKAERNISLYERWVKHNGHTVRELKADFIVKAVSAQDVVALLKNPAKGPRWNTNARNYKIAYTSNDAVWLTYVRYKIPWPMDDQDCSLKYSFNKSDLNSPVCNIYFEGVDTEKFPVVKNVTRITGTRGKWVVQKVNNESLKITYQIVTDKSASVPRWVSDPIIHDNLFKTITEFRKLLEQTS